MSKVILKEKSFYIVHCGGHLSSHTQHVNTETHRATLHTSGCQPGLCCTSSVYTHSAACCAVIGTMCPLSAALLCVPYQAKLTRVATLPFWLSLHTDPKFKAGMPVLSATPPTALSLGSHELFRGWALIAQSRAIFSLCCSAEARGQLCTVSFSLPLPARR